MLTDAIVLPGACGTRGVKIGRIPKWLKDRIIVCGLRSINNVVDVTNFVMLGVASLFTALIWILLPEKRLSLSKLGR